MLLALRLVKRLIWRGWTKYKFGRNRHYEQCGAEDVDTCYVCLAGAMFRAEAILGMGPMECAKLHLAIDRETKLYGFSTYNDLPSTTWEDVLAKIDAAIKREIETMLNFYLGLPHKLRVRFNYTNDKDEKTTVYGEVLHGGESPRKWGEFLADAPVVTHKGNYYLCVKPLQIVKEGVPQDVPDHPRDYKIEKIDQVTVITAENPDEPAEA